LRAVEQYVDYEIEREAVRRQESFGATARACRKHLKRATLIGDHWFFPRLSSERG
jgi:hypothetical protein